jgi:hypothetical protein
VVFAERKVYLWQSVETGLVRNISHEEHGGEKVIKLLEQNVSNMKETVS